MTNELHPRVLLVDDDPYLMRALVAALRSRLADLAEIESCDSGDRAVARVQKARYDVVVSDVLMPGMSGLVLLERVRVAQPECLVILVTGADDRELALHALRGGAYDFIQKPVDADYFVASVRRAIETSGLRREVERQQEALRRHAEDLERTVEERTRELREANRTKDEFLAMISHELRTPLTSILGWSRLLSAGRLDPETQAQALESVERNARSQAQLIDDLLDISRIIMGKLRLDAQPVDVNAALDAALGVVLPAAQAKDIALDPVVAAGLGTVMADPERLQQVLWNLLSNAIKFTPEGGRVELRAAQAGGSLEIVIADNGIGIPPELLPRVFDRFRQGASSARWSRRGLGLGLAIVRHIVELHGGEIRAESGGEGKGSAFRVKLPLRQGAHRGELRSWPRATLNGGPADGRVAGRCLDGVRVLVVDDDRDAREMLILTLELAGAKVTAADTAREGREAMRRAPPDVLLCDIGLPDESGYDLIRRIRALPVAEGGGVPAIALTAFTKIEDREEALAAGFQLHLPKPGPADLAMLVASVARGDG